MDCALERVRPSFRVLAEAHFQSFCFGSGVWISMRIPNRNTDRVYCAYSLWPKRYLLSIC